MGGSLLLTPGIVTTAVALTTTASSGQRPGLALESFPHRWAQARGLDRLPLSLYSHPKLQGHLRSSGGPGGGGGGKSFGGKGELEGL